MKNFTKGTSIKVRFTLQNPDKVVDVWGSIEEVLENGQYVAYFNDLTQSLGRDMGPCWKTRRLSCIRESDVVEHGPIHQPRKKTWQELEDEEVDRAQDRADARAERQMERDFDA